MRGTESITSATPTAGAGATKAATACRCAKATPSRDPGERRALRGGRGSRSGAQHRAARGRARRRPIERKSGQGASRGGGEEYLLELAVCLVCVLMADEACARALASGNRALLEARTARQPWRCSILPPYRASPRRGPPRPEDCSSESEIPKFFGGEPARETLPAGTSSPSAILFFEEIAAGGASWLESQPAAREPTLNSSDRGCRRAPIGNRTGTSG